MKSTSEIVMWLQTKQKEISKIQNTENLKLIQNIINDYLCEHIQAKDNHQEAITFWNELPDDFKNKPLFNYMLSVHPKVALSLTGGNSTPERIIDACAKEPELIEELGIKDQAILEAIVDKNPDSLLLIKASLHTKKMAEIAFLRPNQNNYKYISKYLITEDLVLEAIRFQDIRILWKATPEKLRTDTLIKTFIDKDPLFASHMSTRYTQDLTLWLPALEKHHESRLDFSDYQRIRKNLITGLGKRIKRMEQFPDYSDDGLAQIDALQSLFEHFERMGLVYKKPAPELHQRALQIVENAMNQRPKKPKERTFNADLAL